jgi:4-hydroxybenzoate polyprenyltransferase
MPTQLNRAGTKNPTVEEKALRQEPAPIPRSTPWQTAVDLLRSARPKQWTKNLIVFAPILFAAKIFEPEPFIATCVCAIAFCLVSSAVYLLNDVLDREQDRIHPRKKNRPIAAGRVSPNLAMASALVASVVGLFLAIQIKPSCAVLVLAYWAVMLCYANFLKHIVLVDIMIVASGFVLRAVAGGVAAGVPLSGWFLLCTSFGALFLALEKRRHEITTLSVSAQDHRTVLEDYSTGLIDRIESIVVSGLLNCYIFYSFLSYHGQWMMVTVPFVFYGVIRYQLLSKQAALTGAPEDVLLKDRPTQVTILLWLLTSAAVLYNVIPGGFEHFFQWLDQVNIR